MIRHAFEALAAFVLLAAAVILTDRLVRATLPPISDLIP